MSVLKEFKEFAVKGNLIEMAIAFVMGAAFSKVVSGLIDGIVMPVVGKLTAGVDFKSLKFILNEAIYDSAGKVVTPETAVKYGEFITILIDFTIVAFCMFLLVKTVNTMKRKQAAIPTPPPAPSAEQTLLSEIRDLLKK